MTIEMSKDDPQAKVVELKKGPRQGQFEIKRKSWDGCRHNRTIVDEQNRAVRCRDCEVPLDAFTVLLELAHRERRWLEELDAWDAYRESTLAQRYDTEWQRNQGREITEPPSDPAIRKVWDYFNHHLGSKFAGLYRRKSRKRSGTEWYGKTIDGGLLSIEWVRKQSAVKLEPPA